VAGCALAVLLAARSASAQSVGDAGAPGAGDAGAQRAGASPDVAACIAAHGRGQELRLDAQFIEARASFRVCASESCPAMIRADCATWQSSIAQDIPSIVFSFADVRGVRQPASVVLDGAPLADASTPTEIDPGAHSVRVESPGFVSIDTTVTVRSGERRRTVSMVLQRPVAVVVTPPPDAVLPPRPFRVPTASWVLGGAGVGLVGIWGGLGAHVLVARQDAAQTCAPFCPQSVVGPLRTELLVGDILLATGAAAITAAVVVLIVDRVSPPRVTRSSR
jgi:hypothetical protein